MERESTTVVPCSDEKNESDVVEVQYFKLLISASNSAQPLRYPDIVKL